MNIERLILNDIYYLSFKVCLKTENVLNDGSFVLWERYNNHWKRGLWGSFGGCRQIHRPHTSTFYAHHRSTKKLRCLFPTHILMHRTSQMKIQMSRPRDPNICVRPCRCFNGRYSACFHRITALQLQYSSNFVCVTSDFSSACNRAIWSSKLYINVGHMSRPINCLRPNMWMINCVHLVDFVVRMLRPMQATLSPPSPVSSSSASSWSSTPSSAGIYGIHQHQASHMCPLYPHNDVLRLSSAQQDEDDDDLSVSFDKVVNCEFCFDIRINPGPSYCLPPITKTEAKTKIKTNHMLVFITDEPNTLCWQPDPKFSSSADS